MFLNCAKIVNEYNDTVGYLVVRTFTARPDPVKMSWEFFDLDQYDELLESGDAETFVLWSDTNISEYLYTNNPEEIGELESSYTYLIVEESLYQKAMYNRKRVLLVPQAIFKRGKKHYITVTAIGKDIANYADAVNMQYPTLKQSMYDVASGVYRFVIGDKDFVSEKFFHNNFYCFVSTLSLLEQMSQPYWKTPKKRTTPADRNYCKSIMKFLDDLTDKLVLPDLSDYPNILTYQSLMNMDAEQMSIELFRLEKLYKTTDLTELDRCLASAV